MLHEASFHSANFKRIEYGDLIYPDVLNNHLNP